MTLIPLKNLLPHSLKRNKIFAQVEAVQIIEEFNKIAKLAWGDDVDKEVKGLYVKDKVLTVAVLGSVVASEIRLNKSNIINSINEIFSQKVLTDIRLLM